MTRPFKQINFECHDAVHCVRLRHQQYDEIGLEELGAEMARLIDEDNCRKMVLNLGPDDPLCLYSVFLAKLVNLQRRLEKAGGAFALAGLSGTTRKIFEVAGLAKYFQFYPDQDSAVAGLRA